MEPFFLVGLLLFIATATTGFPAYWVGAARQDAKGRRSVLLVMLTAQAVALWGVDEPLRTLCGGQAIALVLWTFLRRFELRGADRASAELSAPTRRSLHELQFSVGTLLSATATICVAFAVMRIVSPTELPLAGLGIGSAVLFHAVGLVVWLYRPFWGQFVSAVAVYFFVSVAFVPLIVREAWGVLVWLIGFQALVVAFVQMALSREPKPPRTS